MRAIINWPTLISLWSAATGLAIAVFPVEQIVRYGSLWHSFREGVTAYLVFAAVIAFVVLSLFLYLARLWARRALVAALVCFIAAILTFIVAHDWRFVSRDLTRIAIYFIVLVPPLFVLGVLFHPDVVRAFPPKRRPLSSAASNT